jgi:fucose 4-O-acetylase-like acetyltransferase
MENRNYWLDYAKAIGIILVVYGHVARGLFEAGLFPYREIYRYVDSVIYSFHMPLFFFLSGTLFYSSFLKHGTRALLWSKVDTVVYPYLVWSLLQGGIEVTLSSYTNGDTKLSEVLSLLWAPRAHFWFLYALFLFFTIVTAAFAVFGRKALWPLSTIAVATYLWDAPLINYPPLRLVARDLVFFMFGIAFSLLGASRWAEGRAWMVWTLAFLALQYLFHGVLGLNFDDRGPFALLLAFTSIMFIASVSVRAAQKPLSVIVLIGMSSMGIYLMHVLCGAGVRILLQKGFGSDSLMLHLIAGCSVGIIVPMIIFSLRDVAHIKYLFSAPIANTLGRLRPSARTPN